MTLFDDAVPYNPSSLPSITYSLFDPRTIRDMGPTGMEQIQTSFLVQAEREGRFAAQQSEYHIIQNTQVGEISHFTFKDEYNLEKDNLPRAFTEGDQQLQTSGKRTPCSSPPINCLRCVLQRKRPTHFRGRPDAIPFKSAKAMRNLFNTLGLPSSYFQIADGSPTTAKAHTFYDPDGRPRRYEFVANCLTKHGHWAMALSHEAAAWSSSVYWNMDDRVDSEQLVNDLATLQQYAAHPMLPPCAMFAETFRIAVKRRHSMKTRLDSLEATLLRLNENMENQDSEDGTKLPYEPPSNLGRLFAVIHSCKKDHGSRKGKDDFRRTFHGAIQEGFKYTEAVLRVTPDTLRFEQNAELQHWADMTWQRFQSLMARDEDHIQRVENAATTLHNLVQQREIRLQSSIAAAARRDSEDMKYIAVLGSVFLPAGLVASIFNVPAFQFLPGAQLFGAYISITVPFIALVVMMCLTRPYWARWHPARWQSSATQRRESIIIEENLLRCASLQA